MARTPVKVLMILACSVLVSILTYLNIYSNSTLDEQFLVIQNEVRPRDNSKKCQNAFGQPYEFFRQKNKRDLSNSLSESSEIGINNITHPELLSASLPLFTSSLTPWLTKEDLQTMAIMAKANISSTFKIDNTVRRNRFVGLIYYDDDNGRNYSSKDCGVLNCGMLKRADDLKKEVFAFHLDRVLGIKRTPPIIANKWIDGAVRPVISWINDIHHYKGAKPFQANQNSFSFTYSEYYEELNKICNSPYSLNSYKGPDASNNSSKKYQTCKSPIKHIEWGKLATFDFLLQVFDRLDRDLCGYNYYQTTFTKYYNYYTMCKYLKKQHLVHIFVREKDMSRLVFIDNRAEFGQSENCLNFKILQGIHEVPENVINALKSDDLERNLIKSLQIDSIFWNAMGIEEIRDTIDVISRRKTIFLEYIEKMDDIIVVPDY